MRNGGCQKIIRTPIKIPPSVLAWAVGCSDVNAMAQARRVVVVPMKSAVYHCISCVRIGLIGSSGSEVPWYRHAAALDLRQRREKSVHCHALIA